MKHKETILAVTILLLLSSLALHLPGAVVAQSGSEYRLTRSTIDAGGGTSTDGVYTLFGTTGQPDAWLLRGEGYTLTGGFWGGGATIGEYATYLPLVLREAP